VPGSKRLINCLLILKKTATSKLTNLPRACDFTKMFLKDWQRLSHSGRYDMVRLKEAMLLLISNAAPLRARMARPSPEGRLVRPP
jgi:hypothetical protein